MFMLHGIAEGGVSEKYRFVPAWRRTSASSREASTVDFQTHRFISAQHMAKRT
jgi:hypothetical protein